MNRYFRLYYQFVKFSIGRALEFRVDFYFRIVMDVFYYIVNFAFFKIIYLHTDQIGGWNESQAVIFVGCFILVDAINMTLFSNSIWSLPDLVNKGGLDYYLVRPVSSFFMVNFRDFAFNSFVNFLIALGFLIYAIAVCPTSIGFGRYLLFFMMIVNGAWIFHLLHLLFLMPVFWTHSGRGFEQVYWSICKFSERPHGIYQGVLRFILITVLPFILISSYPVETLFQENPWPYVGISFGVGMGFFGAVLLLWKYATRSYSSASS